MPKKRHKAMQLANASKVMRAHSTDIDPPGLVEFENAFQSRSDNAITLRSDWESSFAGMQSSSDNLQGADQEDYLNTAFHVSRAGYTIYFGRWAPFTWVAETGDLFTIYDEGTIQVDGLRTEVIGSSTLWLQQVWPGCLIRAKDDEDGKLYSITHVTSDVRLLTDEPMQESGEYEIYRVHPSNRAEWPIKFESLGGYLIYGSVDITQPIESRFISGPFFSNIGRPNLGVFFGTDPIADEVVIPMAAISVGFDDQFFIYPDRDRMKYFAPIVVAGDKGVVFVRNWLGEDEWVHGTSFIQWKKRETYLFSSGSTANFSYGKAPGTGDKLTSLVGEIISLQTTGERIGGDARNGWQYFYPIGATNSKDVPFGSVVLNGHVSVYYFGDNGLLGIISGTTYATGVGSSLRSGVHMGTNLVIVGDADSTDGVILYFSDPAAISRAVTGTAESFLGVTYSNIEARVIAVGTNGECMTSDDQGATWTGRTVGATSNLNAVCADRQGRAICAVGNVDPVNAACYLSMDGIAWSLVANVGQDNLVDVSFNDTDGAFYAVSEGGRVYRIRRRVQIPAGSLLLSTFGENSDYVCDVFWDGFQFVAVGSKIWTSPIGVTWTERLIDGDVIPDSPLTSVAKDITGGFNWVAVGIGGIILRSTNNGVTWSSVTSPVEVDLVDVIHHEVSGLLPGDFIFIGDEGKVYRSTDGSSWSPMNFPNASNLNAIASDEVNTTPNQKNLYIAASDGLIYTTTGHSGSFDPWEAWEDRPDFAYWDREHVKDNSGRLFQTFPVSPIWSLMAMRAASNRRGTATLIATQSGNQYTCQSLDDSTGGSPVYRFSLGTTEFQSGSNWYVRTPILSSHSLAILGMGTDFPILVRRVWTQSYGGTYPAFDGIVTSCDWGLTWSTEQFTQTEEWSKCQAFTHISSRGVWLASKYFVPICTDGTDWFAIQSSNQLSSKPIVLYMNGLELLWDAEEVE